MTLVEILKLLLPLAIEMAEELHKRSQATGMTAEQIMAEAKRLKEAMLRAKTFDTGIDVQVDAVK